MQELKFKAKPFDSGNSKVVRIPAQYFSNGLVSEDKEYWFIVKEVDDSEPYS